MEATLDDKIRLKRLELSIENDPERKQNLHGQLQKLQLQKEIEQIKKRIEQLG